MQCAIGQENEGKLSVSERNFALSILKKNLWTTLWTKKFRTGKKFVVYQYFSSLDKKREKFYQENQRLRNKFKEWTIFAFLPHIVYNSALGD